mmetsp:Transcript_41172/g.94702  ORF Transcript_41172/g.94702 Transcript_41172/m.94702 type:complete len:786 (-) Transcript_41172:12-2369(-)
MWLPPVLAQKASTESLRSRLLSSLKQVDPSQEFLSVATPDVSTFQTSTCSVASSSGGFTTRPWSLRSISRLGERANHRVAQLSPEFDEADVADAKAGEVEQHGASAKSDAHHLRKAYDKIVMGIDSVLMNGQHDAKLVKSGDDILDTLPQRTVHYYKVQLPARPTQVLIVAHLVSGVMPWIWASREEDQPHPKKHEFRGNNGKLFYDHVLRTRLDDFDESRDESFFTPAFQTLYFAIDAETSECVCRITVGMKHIQLDLTRANSRRLARSRWESRIRELQQEPDERVKFEEHCRDLKQQYTARQLRVHGGKNFPEENVRSIQTADVPSKLIKLQSRALALCARQDAADRRRAEHDKDIEDRKLVKIRRRRQREQEETDKRNSELSVSLQRAWFHDLAMMGFLRTLQLEVDGARQMRGFFSKQMSSAGVMHRFIIRWFCFKRRLFLYREVIKLRVALVVYARHSRMATFHAAQGRVNSFLRQYAFHRESPSVIGTLRRLRMCVIQLQRWWLRTRLRRGAYIDMFLPSWVEFQEALVQEKPEIMNDDGDSSDHSARHSPEPSMRRSITQSTASPKVRKFLRRRRSQTFEDMAAQDSAAPFGQDVIPPTFIKSLLNEYIVSMERSHAARVQQWKEERAQAEFDKDLQAALASEDGAHPSQASRPRPAVVYCDDAELKALVEEKLHLWRTGHYREVRHNYLRLLREYWRHWERYVRSPWLRGDMEARSRAESSHGSKARVTRGSTLNASELMAHRFSTNFKSTLKDKLVLEGALCQFEDWQQKTPTGKG